MSNLNHEIETLLRDNGAVLVGFADLSALQESMPYGISVALPIPPNIIKSIHGGPNNEYLSEYHRLNKALNNLVLMGAEFLISKGYTSYAQTTDAVKQSETYTTPLPHKTVATRAGIGWIGKCALLVTKEFGSGIRISSLTTDAPLECGEPIDASACGDCSICVDNCPGQAASGELWHVGMDRSDFFDPYKCYKGMREVSLNKLNNDAVLCGKCIEVCPYTQGYLSRAEVLRQ